VATVPYALKLLPDKAPLHLGWYDLGLAWVLPGPDLWVTLGTAVSLAGSLCGKRGGRPLRGWHWTA
jgi:hypothetical protein